MIAERIRKHEREYFERRVAKNYVRAAWSREIMAELRIILNDL